MNRPLWQATMCSIAIHAGLLYPGGQIQPATSDVRRDHVSVQIELLTAAQIPLPEKPPERTAPDPEDTSWLESPKTARAPRPPQAPAGHGAFTEAAPRRMSNPSPTYPWVARMRGWEGTVILQVRVEPDGRPSDVRIVESSGRPVLDRAAQTTVQQWEFIPAIRGERAVRSAVQLPVRFRLTATEGEKP